MKKSIVRTSLALAIAGVLGTSVVAYATEAPQIQPVPVVKQDAAQSAPAVKQEATAPVANVDTTVSADKVEAPKIDVSAAIKTTAKPATNETAKPVANEIAKPATNETAKPATTVLSTKPAVTENTKPVVVPAVANPAAASMDADTTPVVAKEDKKDAKTTKVVKTKAKDHTTTKVVKSNKKVQPTQSVKTQKADKTVKSN